MPTKYASEYHVPVMVDEVLEHLAVAPGKSFIDGTLGGGGHTLAILEASKPDGRVLSIDRDPDALAFAGERLADYGERVALVRGNYGDVLDLAADFGPVDGFLVDAGVSSHQFDAPERGFSFRAEGPLDMRMGPDAPSVLDYLGSVDESELARVLREYGEIRSARKIARAILEAHGRNALATTTDLSELVEQVVGRGAGSGRRTTINPATLVFQALRIAVNEELEALRRAVEAIPQVVRPGGRAVFISFHSLEDRVVKQGFRDLCTSDAPKGVPLREDQLEIQAEVLTRRPVTASPEEIDINPRARSAKLRALRVL